MRFNEAESVAELAEICQELNDKGNFEPVEVGPYFYYRRGSGGMFLYRVLKGDFRAPTERKDHRG